MPWHVAVKLPDGRHAFADHRDPIVKVMRRIHKRAPREGAPDDIQTIAAWLDTHTAESAACQHGTCGHD